MLVCVSALSGGLVAAIIPSVPSNALIRGRVLALNLGDHLPGFLSTPRLLETESEVNVGIIVHPGNDGVSLPEELKDSGYLGLEELALVLFRDK